MTEQPRVQRRILAIVDTRYHQRGDLIFYVGSSPPSGFIWYDNEDASALTPEANGVLDRWNSEGT